jgi:hypothetical protein
MRRSNRELWYAFAAILAITLAYLAVVNVLQRFPAASSLFGHAIGILGFVLMLMTEILYSLRKRSRSARWGKMSSWLQFHIFTGLVGPYLVLIHASWNYNGLAGILTLLTLVIVASGFFGRYIYTAVPRTADGAEIAADELERQIRVTEAELQLSFAGLPAGLTLPNALLASGPGASSASFGLVFARLFADWGYRWRWRQATRKLPAAARAQAARLEQLQVQKRVLSRQLASLVMARRLLGLWHNIHMPIGMALFVTAFIHIGGALYYTAYLR